MPAITCLEDNGVDASKVLQSVGLPAELNENDADLVFPVYAVWQMAQRAIRKTRNPGLAFEFSSNLCPADFIEVAPEEIFSTTFLSFLKCFCRRVNTQSTNFSLSVRLGNGEFWLCFKERFNQNSNDSEAIDQAKLGLMLRAIRCYAGEHWCPGVVHLRSQTLSDSTILSELKSSLIELGQSETRISIPLELQARKACMTTCGRCSIKYKIPKSRHCSKLSLGFHDSLAEIIRSYVIKGCADISTISKGIGVSKRTIQRKLGKEGTTFAAMTAKIKLEVAMSLLADPSISIGHVGKQLGYKQTSHFSRAFKTLSGKTPREYRRQIL